MIGSVLQFDDLQKLCKPRAQRPPRRATVEAWARQIGLHYTYDGQGGIISSVEALNTALGVTKALANDAGKYGPDEI